LRSWQFLAVVRPVDWLILAVVRPVDWLILNISALNIFTLPLAPQAQLSPRSRAEFDRFNQAHFLQLQQVGAPCLCCMLLLWVPLQLQLVVAPCLCSLLTPRAYVCGYSRQACLAPAACSCRWRSAEWYLWQAVPSDTYDKQCQVILMTSSAEWYLWLAVPSDTND